MASVRSHGAVPPASPRNGTTSATVSVAPLPKAAASVSSSRGRRPMSSSRCRARRSVASGSNPTGDSRTRSASHARASLARWGTAASTTVPTFFTAFTRRWDTWPPPDVRISAVVGSGSFSHWMRGSSASAVYRPTSRTTTTRRSARNGGVLTASTMAPTATSSPERSSTAIVSSPDCVCTIDRTASPTRPGSSPRTYHAFTPVPPPRGPRPPRRGLGASPSRRGPARCGSRG